MKRKLLLIGTGVLLGGALLIGSGLAGWYMNRFFGATASAATLARNGSEARVLAALQEMRDTGRIRFGVPESDGRRLRLLAEAVGAKNIVEIGTSTGYSGLWLSLGALGTGGKVTTFEIDEGRAAMAREMFRKAGAVGTITVVTGDAHKNLSNLKDPIDLVFMDADKEGYVDYLDKTLPLLRPGGLILAHNSEHAPEYLQRVTSDPGLETVFLTQGSGLSVTMKKRLAP